MRANPSAYEMVAPGNLREIVALMAREPGVWLPIAGGTDVMVQYAAGKLAARKLVSIWNVPQLRRMEVLPDEIRIGAGCSYSDLRQHEVIGREFPLLANSASWTGGIANQNRGTLGGNIVNASPAADSLPALLAYDAELILVSVRGERRVRYVGFHTAYKKMALEADELIQAVCLSRRYADYLHHARKVGARNAQAISKVCLAGLGRTTNGVMEDLRIAMGSVAPIPMRLNETERAVQGRRIDAELLRVVRRTVAAEIRPIDDIRSSTRYRRVVAGNLVEEFLTRLASHESILARWNQLSEKDAADQIRACCGSNAWVQQMVARRPFDSETELMAASEEIWNSLTRADWIEAFRAHPRIGESRAAQIQPERSTSWSAQEQRDVAAADEDLKAELARANREYDERFGHIFIVCATGKSAAEVLEILRGRLRNDAESELHEAAEQQRQITQIRLRKWLQE
jgi:OHCU decarboxylase